MKEEEEAITGATRRIAQYEITTMRQALGDSDFYDREVRETRGNGAKSGGVRSP